MNHWAIDLGTTNTTVARWDERAGRGSVVVLAALCRDPTLDDPIRAPDAIPSATEMRVGRDPWTWVGRLPPFAKRRFWGRHAYIGRPAIERNLTRVSPAFAASFKPALQSVPVRPLVNVGRTRFTARDVARAFLRELLGEITRATGTRPAGVTLTTPVDAYEGYRAELASLLGSFGVRAHRFVDEPVAAAVGYGLSLDAARSVLVVDMGGGTTDLALVRLDPAARGTGHARVFAKAGRDVAGDQVDRWMLEEVCRRSGVGLPDDPFWERLLLDEARRVKEELFVRPSEGFHFRPPGGTGEVEVTVDAWVELLERRGLYAMLDQVTSEVCALGPPPDDVLLVGGSTLLPGVYRQLEQRFGRDRVRAWQPFHAVALGAAAFAAGAFVPADHIVHDYAIVVRDPESGEKRYETVVPAGTPFPTRGPVWHRQLHPVCALGVPERVYQLIVCELGRPPDARKTIAWDDAGRLHRLAAGERMVVPLNEADPTMGVLDPPHQPGDRSPRLDVRFGVNADRWLVATVFDLRSRRLLLDERPVVRLQ